MLEMFKYRPSLRKPDAIMDAYKTYERAHLWFWEASDLFTVNPDVQSGEAVRTAVKDLEERAELSGISDGTADAAPFKTASARRIYREYISRVSGLFEAVSGENAPGDSLPVIAIDARSSDVVNKIYERNDPVLAVKTLYDDQVPPAEKAEVLLDASNQLISSYAKDRRAWDDAVKVFFNTVIRYARKYGDRYPDEATRMSLISMQALNVLSLIGKNVPGSEKMRLTIDPEMMVQSPDKERGPSYLNLNSMPVPQASEEGAPGAYHRGREHFKKMEANADEKMVFNKDTYNATKNIVPLYLMLHGYKEVPSGMRNMTEKGEISTIHETGLAPVFLLPKSAQNISTGPGHFQGTTLDIKYVTEGEGIQYNKFYDKDGRLVKVIAQYLKPRSFTISIPGAVDSVEDLGGLRFNDFSVSMPSGEVDSIIQKCAEPSLSIDSLNSAKDVIGKAAAPAPYFAAQDRGKTVLVRTRPKAPDIVWMKDIFSDVFGDWPRSEGFLDSIYHDLEPGNLKEIKDKIVEVLISGRWQSTEAPPMSVIDREQVRSEYMESLEALDRAISENKILKVEEGVVYAGYNVPAGVLSLWADEIFGLEYVERFGGKPEAAAEEVRKYGDLNDPDIFETEVILSHAQANSTFDITDLTMDPKDDVAFGRYTLDWEGFAHVDPLLLGKAHFVFVEKGSVEILDEQGNVAGILEEREKRLVPAYMGEYTIRNTGDSQAVVFTKHRPTAEESLIISAFTSLRSDAMKERFGEIRKGERKKIMLHVPRAIYKGNFNREKRILKSATHGAAELKMYASENLEKLQEQLKRDDGYEHVFIMLDGDIEKVKNNGSLMQKMADVLKSKMIAIGENADLSFIREIEAAGVILGNTDLEEVAEGTGSAAVLQRIMSRLTGRDITFEDLELFMGMTGYDAGVVMKRLKELVDRLLVSRPVVRYDASEEAENLRKALWSA